MKTTTLETPIGMAIIEGNENGIGRISITEEGVAEDFPIRVGAVSKSYSHQTDPVQSEIPEELQEAVLQLKEYFSGTRTQFSFKIAPEGTEFQQKVWRQLLKIPFGTTVSYLSLAKELGDVKAIRAVAAANGKNPLWIVVPCHRVIGTDGSLTGYAGGIWRKKWLLDHENPPNQTVLF